MQYLHSNELASSFVSKFNNNLSELCQKWGCEAESFLNLSISDSEENLIRKINGNLREEIVKTSMSGREMMTSLNACFKDLEVRRFQDIIKKNVYGQEGAEPTAIVSADGSRLELFSHRGYAYTEDGINFSQWRYVDYLQTNTSYTGMTCEHYLLYNNRIYVISVSSISTFILWESQLPADEIYSSQGTIYFQNPHELFSLSSGANIGNSFLFEENGIWYLIYEAVDSDTSTYGYGYQIYIASSTSMTGTYTKMQQAPIIIEKNYDGVGNPELAMVNNKVYKCDGKYYMYFHYRNTNPGHSIRRAYSYDLINWVQEGPMLDARVPASFTRWSNGDQSICEYKGHCYLFYTRDANQYIDPHEGYPMYIDMCVDFRPMCEILRLKP